MFLNLDKGQEDLKALILKDKKKKKRLVGVMNMGRRFKGPVRQVSEHANPSKEIDNQEVELKEEDHKYKGV